MDTFIIYNCSTITGSKMNIVVVISLNGLLENPQYYKDHNGD